jgi:hypothetical protein
MFHDFRTPTFGTAGGRQWTRRIPAFWFLDTDGYAPRQARTGRYVGLRQNPLENPVVMMHSPEPGEPTTVVRHWLLRSNGMARFFRFGVIGVASVFAFVTFLGVQFQRLDAEIASVIGYLLSVPLNFFGNRRFSYRSNQRMSERSCASFAVHIISDVPTVDGRRPADWRA